MRTPRQEGVGNQPELDHGRSPATPMQESGPTPAGARPLGNALLARLLGHTAAPTPTRGATVQRDAITAATLDDTAKTKGWGEVFSWLNGQPIDFILSWLLSLSVGQFAALQDNMTEMTGNKPRTGIAIDAVGEIRKGPPAQTTIDYYEHRMSILSEETLPLDQRDWIRGLLGVGPNAGKVKAAPAAGAGTPAPAPAAASGGGGSASTSGFGKGQLTTEAEIGAKKPELSDEVAKKLFGKDTFDELVQSYKSIKVFGRQTFVAEEFGNELLKADADARPKIEAQEGHAFGDKDWHIGSISGYQPNKGSGLHPWGVALDIDYALNPYIANEAGDVVTTKEGGKAVKENVVDKFTTPVYHRIALLMLDPPRMSLIPGGGKLTYDTLAVESQAMIAYFALRGDDAKVKAQVDARTDRLDAAMWQTVFNGEDVPADQRAAKLTTLIPQDYTYLSAGPNEEAPNKLPTGVDRPFDVKGGAAKGRDPAKGFLTIRKEVVEALRAQPNMRWGGTDFGAGANGDIMHFDLGKKYNIKGAQAQVKAEAAAAAGTAPVQKTADPSAAAPPQIVLQRHEEGEEDEVEDEILNPPALQRSAIPGSALSRRPGRDAPRLSVGILARIQRFAGNQAAVAAVMRLHSEGDRKS
jgi:hypothetical protein